MEIKKKNTFIQEIINYGIDPYLATFADKIRTNMKIINYHTTNRRLLMFYCVLAASFELDITHNIVELRKLFNLSYQECNKCISKFSSEKTGFILPTKSISVEGQMVKFCKQLGIESDDIVDLLNKALDFDPSLRELSPHCLCGGILLYAINLFELSISSSDVCEIVDLKISTLKKCQKKINKVING